MAVPEYGGGRENLCDRSSRAANATMRGRADPLRQVTAAASRFFTFARIARNLRPVTSFPTRRSLPSMKEIVMTDTESTQSPLQPSSQPKAKSRLRLRRRPLIVAGVLTGIVASGAGIAVAAGPEALGWRPGPRI